MPAIQMQKQIAAIQLSDGVVGTFFNGALDYLEKNITVPESVTLENGVILIGIEFIESSDDNLITHAKLYYDDTNCENGWIPTIGKLGDRPLTTVNSPASNDSHIKVAVMVLDSQLPVLPGVATLILA